MSWTLICYVTVVIAVMTITTVQNVFCLDASAWASWVQAIGSVLAIIGAAAIAGQQSREAERKDRSAELKAIEAASRLSAEALRIVQDVLGHRKGHFTINSFHPAMRRAVDEIRGTLERLPVERMLQDGVLHSVFLIRTQLAHFSELLDRLPLPPFNEIHREQLTAIEKSIRSESESLKRHLSEIF